MSRQPPGDDGSDERSRRRFLRGTAALGVGDIAALAGCSAFGGSDWSGGEEIRSDGYAHSHTFGTAGIHLYACRPYVEVG